MNTKADRSGKYLFYFVLLSGALTVMLARPIAPQAASQAKSQSLNARDLFSEKIDPGLGLKGRVLLRELSGSYRAVRVDSIFHTDDRIRLEFELNTLGYLYILQHGSDSSWDVLFPSAEIRDENNRLEPNRPVQFPREEDFLFDQTQGQEKLYIVLSLKPEPDLERLLSLVRAARSKGPQPDDAIPPLFKAISRNVSADLASRNLTVSQNSSSDDIPDALNAVYAVNASSHEGRVIMELVLNHRPRPR